MYEMNKLQVFQKKFRKNKRIGETKKECFGHSSVESLLEQIFYPHAEEIFEGNAIGTNDKGSLTKCSNLDYEVFKS